MDSFGNRQSAVSDLAEVCTSDEADSPISWGARCVAQERYLQRVPMGRGFGRPGSPSMQGIALKYS